MVAAQSDWFAANARYFKREPILVQRRRPQSRLDRPYPLSVSK